jgi:dihydropteroate synthase
VDLVCGSRSLSLDRVAIMGVLNLTPDSFSDGGCYQDILSAIKRARDMVAQGADVIDVGGESTRPGSVPITANEEMRRVIPVIKELADELTVPISIDTSKPEVMEAAVQAGAGLINDVWALRTNGAMETAHSLGVPVCLVHMKGMPITMNHKPIYENIVEEVVDFLVDRIKECLEIGITSDRLMLDPGFGFGKTFDHNHKLIKNIDKFTQLGFPIVVGLSRKKFAGLLMGDLSKDRAASSAGLGLIAAQGGAKMVRCHDVSLTRDLIRSWEFLETYNQDNGSDACE